MTKSTFKQTTKNLSAKLAKAMGRTKPSSRNLAEELNDQQLVALSAGCGREDRTIAIPERLEDEAISAFAADLISLGLADEASAGRGQPVWRQDPASGQPITLRVTDQALTVLGIDEGDAGKGMEDKEETGHAGKAPDGNHAFDAGSDMEDPVKVSAKAPKAVTAAPSAHAAPDDVPVQARHCGPPKPRAGSKQNQLIAMLFREEGAGITEIATALGWLPHTTRAALTGLRHKGYELGREITGERGSVYRITAMPIMAPAVNRCGSGRGGLI